MSNALAASFAAIVVVVPLLGILFYVLYSLFGWERKSHPLTVPQAIFPPVLSPQKTTQKVGDVTLGPPCSELGCTGQLRSEVTAIQEVAGRPVVLSRVTCTVCGERALDARHAPKDVARVLLAVLLHTGRISSEIHFTKDEWALAGNFDLRFGKRESGGFVVRVSPHVK